MRLRRGFHKFRSWRKSCGTIALIGRERAAQCDLLPRDTLSDEGGTRRHPGNSPPPRRERGVTRIRFHADEKQRRPLDFLINEFGVADCVFESRAES